jgi:zinc transport system substrate-binding protein
MRKIIPFILLALLFSGCSVNSDKSGEKTIYVTITPLRAIVDEITCGDFDVKVVVPDGQSPETYDPTIRELTNLNKSRLVFSIGLINFERSIVEHIDDSSKVVELYPGIELIEGSCSHGHHHHSHGVDPHIWTSPKALYKMVERIRDAVVAEFPDKVEYAEAADRVLKRIESLDSYCYESIKGSSVQAMMIYHPAYTYYAQEYGIEQIAIEHDGKEPSPRQLVSLVNRAKDLDIDVILYQPQYSVDKVSPIAVELGISTVETNPLAEDIMAEIRRVTELICGKNE